MSNDICNVNWGIRRVYYERVYYNRFKEVRDNAPLGRPSTLTTDENMLAVKKTILDNHRITIREVAADDVGISIGSCQIIFMDVLDMKYAAAK